MQLIGEAYQLLSQRLGLNATELSTIFEQWNKGELDSYLIQITAKILAYKDSDGTPLVDKIVDAAGQKGTGKWTVMSSAELGQPTTVIAEATFARFISALKDERVAASKILRGPSAEFKGDRQQFIEAVRQALYASKIISYAQGYMLLRAAATEFSWELNYGGIAQMWRGGCIIRSRFLGDIKAAYNKNPALNNLLLDQFFVKAIDANQPGWRSVTADGALAGIPLPAMSWP